MPQLCPAKEADRNDGQHERGSNQLFLEDRAHTESLGFSFS